MLTLELWTVSCKYYQLREPFNDAVFTADDIHSVTQPYTVSWELFHLQSVVCQKYTACSSVEVGEDLVGSKPCISDDLVLAVCPSSSLHGLELHDQLIWHLKNVLVELSAIVGGDWTEIILAECQWFAEHPLNLDSVVLYRLVPKHAVLRRLEQLLLCLFSVQANYLYQRMTLLMAIE